MAENTTPAMCSEAVYEAARSAGVLIVTTGEEAAIQKFADAIQTAAYAEGRNDQWEEDRDLLRWAYSKLHHISFTKQEDALELDRFKLLLEHGVRA